LIFDQCTLRTSGVRDIKRERDRRISPPLVFAKLLSPSAEDWTIQRTRIITDLRLNLRVPRESLLHALTEFQRYLSEVDVLFSLVKQPKLTEHERNQCWAYFSNSTSSKEVSSLISEYHRSRIAQDYRRDRDAVNDYLGEISFIKFTSLNEQSKAEMMKITSAPSMIPVYQVATESGRNSSKETSQRSGRTAGRGAGRGTSRRNNPGRGNASERVGGRKSSQEFVERCKLNPDTCYTCEDHGHLGRDCKHPKPLNALARDNPHRTRQESKQRSSKANGVFVTTPLRAFAIQRLPQVPKIILDSGASGGAYVSTDAGFDRRTIVSFSTGQPVTGVGAGGTTATFGGTIYIAVPAIVQVNGQRSSQEVVLRFDAVYVHRLVDGGHSLVNPNFSFVHGGVHAIVHASIDEKGGVVPNHVGLQLGAAGALADKSRRVEVTCPRDDVRGMNVMPAYRYLNKAEIEKLVRAPPMALRVFKRYLDEDIFEVHEV